MSVKVDWSVLDKVGNDLRQLRIKLDALAAANEASKATLERIARKIKR